MATATASVPSNVYGVRDTLRRIQKNLQCPICLEILSDPYNTQCGHPFCRVCICTVISRSKAAKCPLCKESISKRSLSENTRLSEIVEAVVELEQAIVKDTGITSTPPRPIPDSREGTGTPGVLLHSLLHPTPIKPHPPHTHEDEPRSDSASNMQSLRPSTSLHPTSSTTHTGRKRKSSKAPQGKLMTTSHSPSHSPSPSPSPSPPPHKRKCQTLLPSAKGKQPLKRNETMEGSPLQTSPRHLNAALLMALEEANLGLPRALPRREGEGEGGREGGGEGGGGVRALLQSAPGSSFMGERSSGEIVLRRRSQRQREAAVSQEESGSQLLEKAGRVTGLGDRGGYCSKLRPRDPSLAGAESTDSTAKALVMRQAVKHVVVEEEKSQNEPTTFQEEEEEEEEEEEVEEEGEGVKGAVDCGSTAEQHQTVMETPWLAVGSGAAAEYRDKPNTTGPGRSRRRRRRCVDKTASVANVRVVRETPLIAGGAVAWSEEGGWGREEEVEQVVVSVPLSCVGVRGTVASCVGEAPLVRAAKLVGSEPSRDVASGDKDILLVAEGGEEEGEKEEEREGEEQKGEKPRKDEKEEEEGEKYQREKVTERLTTGAEPTTSIFPVMKPPDPSSPAQHPDSCPKKETPLTAPLNTSLSPCIPLQNAPTAAPSQKSSDPPSSRAPITHPSIVPSSQPATEPALVVRIKTSLLPGLRHRQRSSEIVSSVETRKIEWPSSSPSPSPQGGERGVEMCSERLRRGSHDTRHISPAQSPSVSASVSVVPDSLTQSHGRDFEHATETVASPPQSAGPSELEEDVREAGRVAETPDLPAFPAEVDGSLCVQSAISQDTRNQGPLPPASWPCESSYHSSTVSQELTTQELDDLRRQMEEKQREIDELEALLKRESHTAKPVAPLTMKSSPPPEEDVTVLTPSPPACGQSVMCSNDSQRQRSTPSSDHSQSVRVIPESLPDHTPFLPPSHALSCSPGLPSSVREHTPTSLATSCREDLAMGGERGQKIGGEEEQGEDEKGEGGQGWKEVTSQQRIEEQESVVTWEQREMVGEGRRDGERGRKREGSAEVVVYGEQGRKATKNTSQEGTGWKSARKRRRVPPTRSKPGSSSGQRRTNRPSPAKHSSSIPSAASRKRSTLASPPSFLGGRSRESASPQPSGGSPALLQLADRMVRALRSPPMIITDEQTCIKVDEDLLSPPPMQPTKPQSSHTQGQAGRHGISGTSPPSPPPPTTHITHGKRKKPLVVKLDSQDLETESPPPIVSPLPDDHPFLTVSTSTVCPERVPPTSHLPSDPHTLPFLSTSQSKPPSSSSSSSSHTSGRPVSVRRRAPFKSPGLCPLEFRKTAKANGHPSPPMKTVAESTTSSGVRKNRVYNGGSSSSPPSFVGSCLSNAELRQVKRLAKAHGGRLAACFNRSTTHLIVNTDQNMCCPRTHKYLQALASGTWIVSYEWVKNSLEEGTLLPEGDYEVKGDHTACSDAPHRSRTSRMKLGSGLFSNYHFILKGESSTVSNASLVQLIQLGGGMVARDGSHCGEEGKKTVVICDSGRQEERCGLFPMVTSNWVLNSLSEYSLQGLEEEGSKKRT